MEYTIELAATWDCCPSSWKNFITDLRQRNTLEYSEASATIIINELALYHAHIPETSLGDNDDDAAVLSFATPNDRTWFLLKWT